MVWNGYDNNSPVKSNDSKITKRIWAKTINNIKTNNKKWYEIPEGITYTYIDPISGNLKEDGYICYYEKGSEPNYNYNELIDTLLKNK